MNETLGLKLRAEKAGRKLAEYYLQDFVERSGRLVRGLGLEEHICLMTFGSAGNHFLTGQSDTDFTVIDDGQVSEEEIGRLQRGIYDEFGGAPWCVSFKCWDRLKVNPMDVISLYYICGNKDIMREKVLEAVEIADTVCRDSLVNMLVGNDLHIEFMSSRYFSDLLNRYHPTWELPVPISFGDVKYYSGGLRSIQYIYMTAMLLNNKRFIADVNRNDFILTGFLDLQEMTILEKALDFMLSAKDQCREGNNIFHKPNLDSLNRCWKQSEEEIKGEYTRHTEAVRAMCKKALQALVSAFPDHIGVAARTTKDESELERVIESGSLELWRTLALRRDLPAEARKLLTDKILERQKSRPHTMLDELAVMLEYSAGVPFRGPDPAELERSLWFTDSVFRCFTMIMGSDTDNEVLVRLAVHTAFLEMYLSGKETDPAVFREEFMDRVRKYFHCHTLFPDRETGTAVKACQQILSSGLFVPGKMTLMEIHPTNNCNLHCRWCTYRDRERSASLTIGDIRRAASLQPAEVLIAGGGEPALFRDGPYGFSDMIGCLRTELPGARLRLITNGTFIPDGDWTEEIDEISVSLDEADAESYLDHKGRDLFDRVMENVEEYLRRQSPPIIRVTKIYSSESIMDAIALAEKMYRIWHKLPDGSAKKRCFKFMLFPMANDSQQGSAYACSILNDQRTKEWSDALNLTSANDPGLFAFLREYTNLLTIADGVPSEEPFDCCPNLSHYLLLGADGILYPCFAACSSFPSLNLGRIGQDPDSLYEKRCELFYRKPLNCEKGCRPGNVFYGRRSHEYFEAQRKFGLPFLEKPQHKEPLIVHVSYQDPDHIMGGQGWAVSNLCREQLRKGLQVYWISPCVKDEMPGEYLYEKGKLRVIKLKFTDQYVETLFSDDYDTHLLREAFGRIAESEIRNRFRPGECMIHLHGFIEVPSHSEGLRAHGYSVLSTFHMLLSTRRQHILKSGKDLSYMKEAEWKAVAGNAYISVPAKGMIEELSEACPEYQGVYECIPNGIGDEHFDTPGRVPDDTTGRIVSFGRISPEKGFDLLIEAAKIYYDRKGTDENGKMAEFVIFGNTDMSVKARREYAQRLVSMASGYGGIKVLASTTGIIGTDKINMIDKASFGVIPSLYEPFGLVIPEIMARGKPVIATCTSGAYDIMMTKSVGRNDFGFIVEQDPRAIYEAIAWMLDHPDECGEMGRNAFERAQDFRWELIEEQFYALYEKIRRQ